MSRAQISELAQRQGRNAYETKVPLIKNPHGRGTPEHKGWERGWDERYYSDEDNKVWNGP